MESTTATNSSYRASQYLAEPEDVGLVLPKDYLNKPPSTSSSTSVSSREGSPVDEAFPKQAASFFDSVSPEGFPKPKSHLKTQPWRSLLEDLQPRSSNGRAIVACPKKCVYGSNNLGGL
ncbi:uncharacterized protein PAC_05317 [Phialocephala subalpina]|uniref:Uncharacterized protein n=1 Tax=Phialocephala subalpina TaxID=576137 RepID=A0A1L7WRP6_9HELO|nr:uncharacterized protein PAC_05317 [Phialocephala subalpina]